MVEYEVEEASITCRIAYNNVFIPLLEPGDEDFQLLYQALIPFNVGLNSMTFEGEGNKLADDGLKIWLSNNQFLLRITYGGIELTAPKLVDGGATLVQISEAIFPIFRRLGADLSLGRVLVNWTGYLSLKGMEVAKLLSTHLNFNETLGDRVKPDAFAYRFALRDTPDSPLARIVVATSAHPQYPLAGYVDFAIEYLSAGEPAMLAQLIDEDLQQGLGVLGLKEVVNHVD